MSSERHPAPNVHTFAGNPLDRGDALRRDDGWLETAAREAESRFLPFSNLSALMRSDGDTVLQLEWLGVAQLDALAIDWSPVFLGLADDVAHFAVDVSGATDPLVVWQLAAACRFEDPRAAAAIVSGPESGILAQARAQLHWHVAHAFCGRCGAPTRMGRGGHVRVCDACDTHAFPRTDPVVIMLVDRGDFCLLGQSAGRLARTGMYSALAGFVDQGESIEEAVRREVLEEAGIHVGDVSYHSSQPWPYPSSLMIGCHGRARTTDITIDPEEMADVRWFDRAEVRAALAGTSAGLKVPGPIAIAHHLIKAWVDGA